MCFRIEAFLANCCYERINTHVSTLKGIQLSIVRYSDASGRVMPWHPYPLQLQEPVPLPETGLAPVPLLPHTRQEAFGAADKRAHKEKAKAKAKTSKTKKGAGKSGGPGAESPPSNLQGQAQAIVQVGRPVDPAQWKSTEAGKAGQTLPIVPYYGWQPGHFPEPHLELYVSRRSRNGGETTGNTAAGVETGAELGGGTAVDGHDATSAATSSALYRPGATPQHTINDGAPPPAAPVVWPEYSALGLNGMHLRLCDEIGVFDSEDYGRGPPGFDPDDDGVVDGGYAEASDAQEEEGGGGDGGEQSEEEGTGDAAGDDSGGDAEGSAAAKKAATLQAVRLKAVDKVIKSRPVKRLIADTVEQVERSIMAPATPSPELPAEAAEAGGRGDAGEEGQAAQPAVPASPHPKAALDPDITQKILGMPEVHESLQEMLAIGIKVQGLLPPDLQAHFPDLYRAYAYSATTRLPLQDPVVRPELERVMSYMMKQAEKKAADDAKRAAEKRKKEKEKDRLQKVKERAEAKAAARSTRVTLTSAASLQGSASKQVSQLHALAHAPICSGARACMHRQPQ